MDTHSLIQSSAEVMSGAAVFAGTRVPVKTLFDYLKSGDTVEEFLDDFPTVSREHAVAVLELASKGLIDAAITGRVAAKETQTQTRSA